MMRAGPVDDDSRMSTGPLERVNFVTLPEGSIEQNLVTSHRFLPYILSGDGKQPAIAEARTVSNSVFGAKELADRFQAVLERKDRVATLRIGPDSPDEGDARALHALALALLSGSFEIRSTTYLRRQFETASAQPGVTAESIYLAFEGMTHELNNALSRSGRSGQHLELLYRSDQQGTHFYMMIAKPNLHEPGPRELEEIDSGKQQLPPYVIKLGVFPPR
jgi:hypothetical protein